MLDVIVHKDNRGLRVPQRKSDNFGQMFDFSFFFFLQDRVLCIPNWLQTHYIAENKLELLNFLPLPLYPEHWDCRHWQHTWFMQ